MKLLQHDLGKFKRVDRLGLAEVNERLRKAEMDRDYFREQAVAIKNIMKNSSKSRDRN